MSALLPESFPDTGESPIASYNAMDAALGVGYVNYYGLYATSTKALTISTFDSTIPYTAATVTSVDASMVNYTKLIDLDFDIAFKTPQIIEGKALASYTVKSFSTSNGHEVWTYGIIRLSKVNAEGNETELVSATSAVLKNTAGTTYGERISEVLTVPNTHFAIDETLRLTIELWGVKSNGSYSGTITLYHDPSNRVALGSASKDYTSYTNHDTNLLVAVPYRIDL